MNDNIQLRLGKVVSFIGELTVLNTQIEDSINELLTSYFFTSNHKKDEFMRFMLYRCGLSYQSKIDCLRFIADSIKDKARREQFEQTILFAMRFNMVKEKLVCGRLLHVEDPEKMDIRTVNEIYRYDDSDVSPEYVDGLRRTALNTISELKAAKKYFDENT